ncbi:hypothetical protein E2562_011426, partial [Oryza meyeriana var. granulata]
LDKSNIRKLDYDDATPLDDDEDTTRPMGAKAAKAQRSGKGKIKIQGCTTDLEDGIRKFMDVHKQPRKGKAKWSPKDVFLVIILKLRSLLVKQKSKAKFAAGLLKHQSGTSKTIARDHGEGH